MYLNGSVNHEFIDARLHALEEFIDKCIERIDDQQQAYSELNEESPEEDFDEFEVNVESNIYTFEAAIELIKESWRAVMGEHSHILRNADFSTVSAISGESFLAPICRMFPDLFVPNFLVSVIPDPNRESKWKVSLRWVSEKEIESWRMQMEWESARSQLAEECLQVYADNHIVVLRADLLKATAKPSSSTLVQKKKPKK